MTLAGWRVAMTIPAIGNASSTTPVAIVTTRSAPLLPRLSGFSRSRVSHASRSPPPTGRTSTAKTPHASRPPGR